MLIISEGLMARLSDDDGYPSSTYKQFGSHYDVHILDLWSAPTEMTAYYNENDPRAAAWLRELIKGGHIADGHVDERSIWDVCPGDIAGFTQCHFFAGIGGWSYALRLAGWPDDRPVWTGSCPCQPFSAAGKGRGFADERHLWPAFFHLIEQCRPGVVYGEQVASALGWLDLVFDDCEGAGYACRAEDLCAAGVGAPHTRQRLYWVADAGCIGDEPEGRKLGGAPSSLQGEAREQRFRPDIGDGGDSGRVADTSVERPQERVGEREYVAPQCAPAERGGSVGRVGDVDDTRPTPNRGISESERTPNSGSRAIHGSINGFWRDADWLGCRDGKWRPIEPGCSPLDHGASDRVGRLRGYGNAIVPQVAAEFIMSTK